jgi:hypothetical protein
VADHEANLPSWSCVIIAAAVLVGAYGWRHALHPRTAQLSALRLLGGHGDRHRPGHADSQCVVAFPGTGYTFDAFFDRETGSYPQTEARMGKVGPAE